MESCGHPLPTPSPSPSHIPGGPQQCKDPYITVRPGATQWKVVGIHFSLPPLPLPTSQGGLKNAEIPILRSVRKQRNGKLWASTSHSLPSPFPHPRGASKMQRSLYYGLFGSNAMESCGHPLPTPSPSPSHIPGGPQKCKDPYITVRSGATQCKVVGIHF